MTKQPSYRFAGYTESWVEKKLGEIVERITRKNKNLESDLPLTISAQYGLIDQETFFNKKVASKDVSGYYLLKKGEFAYNKSYSSDYPWGAVKRLDNYEMGVLSTLYIVFRPNSIDSDFLAVYYDSPKWYKEVSMRAAEGARNHGLLNISPQDFFDTELIFPVNQSEQTAIGSFFQDIDQLISLQQRKLEVLKEQKKTYLKLLFPAKGQTKSALRFAGFEDEWKEVKVSDIFRVTRGQVLATTEISEEKTDTHKYPVYSSQTKNEGLLGYYDKYLFETAITWTTDGANAGTVNYREGKFYSTNVNGVLLSDEGFANKVIAEILNKEAWKYVSKVGNPKLMNNVMSEISLVIPNDFREISILSSLFQDLDKFIALQQRRLDKLQNMKKALLEQMMM